MSNGGWDMTDHSELNAEFEKRRPWITGFEIDGIKYGGDYFPAADWRLKAFCERVQVDGKWVLELGPLEGGFTVELLKMGAFVKAFEGRKSNLEKAKWITNVIEPRKTVTWHLQDLDNPNILPPTLDDIGAYVIQFDVCFNVGLLYHLTQPWVLLDQLRTHCKSMFLWTHVSTNVESEWGGYAGRIHHEGGQRDSLSGLSIASFWPTFEELSRMLAETGWTISEVIDRKTPDPPEFSECLLMCG